MLPLWLDLRARKIVVFGGGPVGRRKANYLAKEAEVAVVAREFQPGFDERVRLITAEIEEVLDHWVGWADLVIAATSDQELNEKIALAAAKKGKFCNRADGVSSFLIPSVVERGSFKVAISTEGRSPGMSKYLRIELDKMLGPRYDLMVRLQEELRGEAMVSIPSQKQREERLWDVLRDPQVWDLLERDFDAARKLARAKVVD